MSALRSGTTLRGCSSQADEQDSSFQFSSTGHFVLGTDLEVVVVYRAQGLSDEALLGHGGGCSSEFGLVLFTFLRAALPRKCRQTCRA